MLWLPCFHHILELVLGAVIQSRWKTSGPRDAVYKRFKDEWPKLLQAMPEITRDADEKVNLFTDKDDETQRLIQRLHSLLEKLIGPGDGVEVEVDDEEEQEDEAESDADTEGASGGAADNAEKPKAEKPKSSSIPRGDYLEFVRLVAVCNFCAEPRQRKWQLQSLEIFIKV